MSRGMRIWTRTAIALTAFIAGPLVSMAADEVNFEGKTVEILVNYAAGGGTDTAARLVAPYIAKHLPGEPSIIVKNRAGAAGNAGIQYLIDSVAPDGLVIGYFSGTKLYIARDDDRLPGRAADLNYVAARSVNHVLVTGVETGLSSETLARFTDRFFLTANAPDNAQALRMRFLSDAIGAEGFRLVSGYKTQGRMVSAVRAKEADIAITNDSFFGSNRDAITGDDVVVPLGQMGEFVGGKIVPQKGLEDIPVFDEIWRTASPETVGSPAYKSWEAIHMAMAMQHVFTLPIGTPEPYQNAWESAILAAYSDPDYISQLVEIGVPVPSAVSADEIAALTAKTTAVFRDQEVRKAVEDAVTKNME